MRRDVECGLHERAAISRMILRVVEAVHLSWFSENDEHHSEPMGRNLDAIFVGMLVVIGTSEGKPLTLSGISKSLDMPHQTVARKLRHLMEIGIVQRRGDRYEYVAERLDRPERRLAVLNARKRVVRCALELQKLSKMDR